MTIDLPVYVIPH